MILGGIPEAPVSLLPWDSNSTQIQAPCMRICMSSYLRRDLSSDGVSHAKMDNGGLALWSRIPY